ncbi:MAG: hypothetical protein IJ733_20395 [Lachnospiraceae bacterium]|nr:hypothetical protein [Lachnospiraceae bacterium]
MIDSMHGIFMAAWNSYQDKIKGVFGIGEESEMEKLPIEDFSIILARFEILKSALEDFDVDSADEQMAELLKYRYPEEAGEKLRRLQAAVADLDVEPAKELVGGILRIVQGDYSVL